MSYVMPIMYILEKMTVVIVESYYMIISKIVQVSVIKSHFVTLIFYLILPSSITISLHSQPTTNKLWFFLKNISS